MFNNFDFFRKEADAFPVAIALRNMLFDPMFYDVAELSAAEFAQITDDCASGRCEEGGMLLMQPGEGCEYHSTSKALCEAHPDLDAIAVAGVGSSPLGTAALARQVANTIGRPVAGVISSYGLCDVVAEGLGGWFDFGMRNRVLSAMDYWRRFSGLTPAGEVAQARKAWEVMSTVGSVDEEDVNTVVNLMLRQNGKLRLMVGHSKGAMVLQRACDYFIEEEPRQLPPGQRKMLGPQLRVATFGCGVTLPERFSNATQFVGTWDVLGLLNTPWSLGASNPQLNWVPDRLHDLVKVNPFHMPIEEKLPAV